MLILVLPDVIQAYQPAYQPTSGPGVSATALPARVSDSGSSSASASVSTLAASVPATSINVNIATVAQLLTIKGIGPKTAALIVSERERAGPYVSFQDFVERIRGIGPKRAAALWDAGVRVSSGPPLHR